METRTLRYFLAAAEELNLRKASGRLGIQKPPLSRAISNLELDVGTALFDRSGRRLRLTAAGEQLLRDARIILRLIDRAGVAARDAAVDVSPVIRLGVAGSGASRSVDRFLQALCRLVPSGNATTTELPTSLQVQLLLDGRLDAGIVIPPVDEPGLIVQPLWREPLVVLVPEHHALANEAALCSQQLAGEKLILPHPDFGSGSYQQIVEALIVDGKPPTADQYTFSRESSMALVGHGYGVAFVPSSLEIDKSAPVAVRPFAPPAPELQIAAAVRDDERATELLRLLNRACDEAGL
ncbi:MAG: LysR family transcriptional regulator [Silicimonas sp.]|jgi:DNA-binding transcriptional LysR family regulator|uniref:LysR family transcriptional regulator n=1 Tax=Roseitalea porphyridii TaxID=1852022 RepID=UPI0032F048F5